MPTGYLDAGPAEGVRMNPYVSQYVPLPYQEMAQMGANTRAERDKAQAEVAAMEDAMAKQKYVPEHQKAYRDKLQAFSTKMNEYQQKAVEGGYKGVNQLKKDVAKEMRSLQKDRDWLTIQSTYDQTEKALKIKEKYGEDYSRKWGVGLQDWQEKAAQDGVVDKEGNLVGYQVQPSRQVMDFSANQHKVIDNMAKSGYDNEAQGIVNGLILGQKSGWEGLTAQKALEKASVAVEPLMHEREQVSWLHNQLSPEAARAIQGYQSLSEIPEDLLNAIGIKGQEGLKARLALDLYGRAFRQVGGISSGGNTVKTTSAWEDMITPDLNQWRKTEIGLGQYNNVEDDLRNGWDKAVGLLASVQGQGAQKAVEMWSLKEGGLPGMLMGGKIMGPMAGAVTEKLVTEALSSSPTWESDDDPYYLGTEDNKEKFPGAGALWKSMSGGKDWADMSTEQRKTVDTKFRGAYNDLVKYYTSPTAIAKWDPTNNKGQAGPIQAQTGTQLFRNMTEGSVTMHYVDRDGDYHKNATWGQFTKDFPEYKDITSKEVFGTGYMGINNPFSASAASVQLTNENGKKMNVFVGGVDAETDDHFSDEHELQMALHSPEYIGKVVKVSGGELGNMFMKVTPKAGATDAEIGNPSTYTVKYSTAGKEYTDSGWTIDEYLRRRGLDINKVINSKAIIAGASEKK